MTSVQRRPSPLPAVLGVVTAVALFLIPGWLPAEFRSRWDWVIAISQCIAAIAGGIYRMVRTTAARRLLARTWKGPQTSRAVSDSFHDGEPCSRIHIGHVPVPDLAGSLRSSNEC